MMFCNCPYDSLYIFAFQFIVHRKPYEAIRESVTVLEFSAIVFVLVVGTAVKAEVVEDGEDVVVFEFLYELGTFFKVVADKIEHMGVVGGVGWDVREGELAFVW